jgi:hypothetical protein
MEFFMSVSPINRHLSRIQSKGNQDGGGQSPTDKEIEVLQQQVAATIFQFGFNLISKDIMKKPAEDEARRKKEEKEYKEMLRNAEGQA